jgi:hypothetical protein
MKGPAMHTTPHLRTSTALHAQAEEKPCTQRHGPASAMGQKGSVTLLVALTLPVLLGAAALAVDLAYLHVVRNELQNDADAAALAGARVLYHKATGSLNWSGAHSQAQSAIGLNRAAGAELRDGVTQTGYWNLSAPAGSLQALPMTPTANDAPAVQVTVRKADGHNDGPVRIFLARIWGVDAKPVQATAVAGVTSPGSVKPGGVFPLAMSECMYQKFWNTNAQPPGPHHDPATGEPYVLKIGSLYHYENCDSGAWTSLDHQSSGADAIDKLIRQGNLVTLSVGDQIWLQTGVKTSLYQDVQQCSAAGNRQCEYVVVPALNRVVSGTMATIVGFACLNIQTAVGGNEKYILAQMSNQCQAPYGGGTGPNYGVVSPPSLFH